MELTDLERLTLATVVEKACRRLTDPRPRRGETLRTIMDDSLREQFASTGADRVRLKLNGTEVGTYSLTFTKPVHGTELAVEDMRALVEWLRTTDEGADVLGNLVVGASAQKAIASIAKDFGFLPDGCVMREVEEPERIKGTMMRVDEAKVASALAGELPQALSGLLLGDGGGE